MTSSFLVSFRDSRGMNKFRSFRVNFVIYWRECTGTGKCIAILLTEKHVTIGVAIDNL